MKNGEQRLGRGLQSLLPDMLDLDDEIGVGEDAEFLRCSLTSISPNPYQPRRSMEEKGLSELAASIREKGVLQPLVVCRKEGESGFELIAGERRLRAAKIAGLDEVPVIVRKASEADRLELALIENIQRHDLNPIEEAFAYRRLVDEFDLTQEEVAGRVGKERSTVANIMRLLQLPDYVKDDLSVGRISMGHARVLLAVDDEQELKELRDRIVAQRLSVRQVEQIVKQGKQQKAKKTDENKEVVKKPLPESYCKTLSGDVSRILGTKSKIIQNGSRGKIEIEYYSLDDLERIHGFLSSLLPGK